VYLYNYTTNRRVCVSCDPSGAAPLGGADFTLNSADATGSFSDQERVPRAISNDGTRVFFDSPDPLVPADVNGKSDVYEYDLATGEPRLISSGRSDADSLFVEASADGRDVFFVTRQRLVPGDVDNNTDLYDARIDGGLPATAPPPACTADACQGPPAAGPPALTPASATGGGAGNLPSQGSTTAHRRSTARPRRLTKALKACSRVHDKHRRAACRRAAHRNYATAKHTTRTKGRR
jgi:hypothetical protein